MSEGITVYKGVDFSKLETTSYTDLQRVKSELSFESLYSDIANQMYIAVVQELNKRGDEYNGYPTELI